jgi:hypothetical protein
MTDRELLELAAKAAGGLARFDISPDKWPWLQAVVDGKPQPYPVRWNPLTDDGDALRLACHLRINIEHIENSGRRPFGVNCWPLGRGDCGHTETDVTDYNAATRRAIVRAAAEIGRGME